MARTFNRAPLSVPTPSKNDLQEYFFTNSNFKGLSNDKNFLTVDQETFSDCNNVYVDSEGLLKSRPALHKENLVVKLPTGEISLSAIQDVWTFGDVVVYKTASRLTFVNSNFSQALQVTILSTVKLVLVENKIFLFEPQSLKYYDIDTNTVSTASDGISKYLYVPITKLVKNGVTEDLESENELTTSHIIRYLFDNVTNSNFNILLGKNVTVTLDNVEYNLTFVKDNELVFVQKISDLTLNYENVSISDMGNMIISEKISENQYRIYYSPDGLTFTLLSTLNDAVTPPVISADGLCICYATTTELYAYNVLDDGTGQSGQWYKLLSSDNETFKTWLEAGLIFGDITNISIITNDTYAIIAKNSNFPNVLRCIVSYSGTLYTYLIRNGVVATYLYCTNETENVDITSYGTTSLDPVRFIYTIQNESTLQFGMQLDLSLIYNRDRKGIEGTIKYFDLDTSNNEDIVYKSFDIQHAMDMVDSETFKIGDVDVTINFDYDSSTATIQFHSNSTMYVDYDYPFNGTSFASFVNNFNKRSNIYMYTTATQFFVAINAGEICMINSNLDREVTYVGRYWNELFEPCNYGITITDKYLYFTAPNFTIDTLSLYSFKITDDELVPARTKLLSYSPVSRISASGRVLTNKYLYLEAATVPLLFEATPINITDSNIYLFKDGVIYSTFANNVIQADERVNGVVNYLQPEYVSEIDNIYFAKDKKLYISSYPSDGEFKWYFPKINTEQFDYEISNIHPISATEMAVFLEDSVYYIQRSEQGYLYYKSKIQVGCRKGSSIITTFDGKYIVFASTRGLVALSYQDFVASTEQTLTYLSDAIHDVFKAYNDNPIQLFKYDFWILCYKQGSNTFLLFDIRNNSWWPMELSYPINKFIVNSDVVKILCDGKIYTFTYDDYCDFDGVNKGDVDWYFTSQKLHLNAPNYYKHISNITLISVLDSDEDIYLDLTLYNYRKKMHQSEIESFKFNVDSIRTYVKRLNYSKVNEFQYLLTSNVNDAADEEEALNVPKVPLSLSSITVKYKISGQVR